MKSSTAPYSKDPAVRKSHRHLQKPKCEETDTAPPMMPQSSSGATPAVGPGLFYPTNSGYLGQDHYNLGRGGSSQPPFLFHAHRSDSGPYYSTAHYVHPVYFAPNPPPPYQRRISIFLRQDTNADIWRCARFLEGLGGLMDSSPVWKT